MVSVTSLVVVVEAAAVVAIQCWLCIVCVLANDRYLLCRVQWTRTNQPRRFTPDAAFDNHGARGPSPAVL